MSTIHATCRVCGRVKPDALRLPQDPPDAVAVLTDCPECGRGPKEVDAVYVGKSGEVIQ